MLFSLPLASLLLWADEPTPPRVDPDASGAAIVRLRNDGQFAAAEPLQRRLYEQVLRAFGPDDRRTLRESNKLAALLDELDRLPDAEQLHRRNHAAQLRLFGPEDPDTLISLSNLAVNLKMQNRLEESIAFQREVLRLRQAGGASARAVAHSMNALALSLSSAGHSDEALVLYREAFALIDKDPTVSLRQKLSTRANVAFAMSKAGKLKEAVAEQKTVLQLAEKSYGASHYTLATDLKNYGDMLVELGDMEAAEQAFRRGLAIEVTTYPGDASDVIDSRWSLGWFLSDANPREAHSLYRQAMAGALSRMSNKRDFSGSAQAEAASYRRLFEEVVMTNWNYARSDTE